jgi:hypothetical protein
MGTESEGDSTQESTGDIPRPRDEIVIRAHERRQLTEFLPECIEHYDSMPETEQTVAIYDELVELNELFSDPFDGSEKMYDIGADTIETLCIALTGSLPEEQRAQWLRAKIARRSEQPVTMMGFSTVVPIMPVEVGKTPKRPDRFES